MKRPVLTWCGVLLAVAGYMGLAAGDVAHGGIDRMSATAVAIRVGDPVVPAAFAGAVLAFGLCLALAGTSRR